MDVSSDQARTRRPTRSGRRRSRRASPRLGALLVAASFVVVSCGSDSGSGADPAGPGGSPADGSVPTGSVDAPVVTDVAPVADEGGWIGGRPDFEGEMSDDATTDDAIEAPAEGPVEREAAGADVAEFEPAIEPADAPAIEPAPVPPDEPPLPEPPLPPTTSPGDDASPLRAGSVDDNEDYEGFVRYLERLAGLGIAGREFDSTGRTVLTVTGADGAPAAGVAVTATVGEVSAALRTTADGTARFLPGLYGPVDGQDDVLFAVGDASVGTAIGVDAELVLDEPTAVGETVALDVLFLLDATGSMGDEIDRLKATIDLVAERVDTLEPRPEVRFAMTLYRDEGDSFVTSTYDFTSDVAAFRAALAEVIAEGGGDYPEALDEGLAEALTLPSWREPSDAVQLVFVVADAPPQVGRQVDSPYPQSARLAIERGIKIFPVASSESDDQAELVFRQLAQATGAPFVFLTYGAGGAATGSSTDIETTDYEELALDELVVRLIAEELADLAGPGGPPVTTPPTSAPPTTNPPGQD